MSTTAPAPPSVTAIVRALGEFQLTVTSEQVLHIQQYIRILLHWNDKVNLTAIRDPLEILYRHFCECMYAAVAVPIKDGRLADVGSGGGFPGLPLKIMCPDLRVFLVESSIKKVTFLAEVTRELGLKDVQVLARRYEELGEEVAPLDFVCSRALGEFPAFLEWAKSQQIAARRVILWIGARDLPEIQKVRTWDWAEPIQVPNSLRRLLLVGSRRPSVVGAST
jgi:16S rRNA (guanine527-N7)-methyltransferase